MTPSPADGADTSRTPSARPYPDTLRSYATFVRDCYHCLSEAEAGVVVRELNTAADRIEQLERELTETRFKHGYAESMWLQWEQTATNLLKRAESAEAQLAEAKRDAERYRWLTQQHCTVTFDQEIRFIPPGSLTNVYVRMVGYTELDAAIDAALIPQQSAPEQSDVHSASDTSGGNDLTGAGEGT